MKLLPFVLLIGCALSLAVDQKLRGTSDVLSPAEAAPGATKANEPKATEAAAPGATEAKEPKATDADNSASNTTPAAPDAMEAKEPEATEAGNSASNTTPTAPDATEANEPEATEAGAVTSSQGETPANPSEEPSAPPDSPATKSNAAAANVDTTATKSNAAAANVDTTAPASGTSATSNPDVTESFCLGVLQEIKDRKAPYFVEGKWTEECRSDLINQCSSVVCSWKKKYNDALGAVTNDGQSCNDFTKSMLEDENGASTIEILISRAGAEVKTMAPETMLRFKALRLSSKAPGDLTVHVTAPTESANDAMDAAEANARSAGTDMDPLSVLNDPEGPPATVTEKFCLKVIRDIENKRAPYFVDGKFTGEHREELVNQCAEKVCNWHSKVRRKIDEACKSDKCPTDCSNPSEYVKNLLAEPEKLEAAVKGSKDVTIKVTKEGEKKAEEEPCKEGDCPEGMKNGQPNDPNDNDFVALSSTHVGTIEGKITAFKEPTEKELAEEAKKEAEKAAKKSEASSKQEAVEKPEVTQKFCEKMIKDIADQKAPYFVEGKYTGEMRESILRQCSQQVCNWAKKYSDAVGDCGEKCPADCVKPTEYFDGLTDSELSDLVREVNLTVITVHQPGKGVGVEQKTLEAGSVVEPVVPDDPNANKDGNVEIVSNEGVTIKSTTG
eukprot:g4731.t1